MSINASTQVGSNLSYTRSPYFQPHLIPGSRDEADGLANNRPGTEPVEVASSPPPTILNLTQANQITAEVIADLADRPAKIAVKIHQPEYPSLLGSTYV